MIDILHCQIDNEKCEIGIYIYSMTTKLMNRSVQAHPFHLVEASPWPIAVSFSLLVTTLSGVMTFHGYSNGLFLLTLGLISLVSTMTLWFKDIAREGKIY